MASIDEAYLDITGTERLYGPPLRAAHLLHERMKAATNLNCSIGIAASRLVAKISSDQAKPNGVLWIIPGQEAAFLAPLDVRKMPGVGKVTEKNLHALRHPQGGRPGAARRRVPGRALREMGTGAGRQIARPGRGRLVRYRDRRRTKGRNRSATSTRSTRTRRTWTGSNPRWRGLSEMVGRRLREHKLQARTLQLKLRYSDFSTITRAHSMPRATHLDTEIFDEVRELFRRNWKPGATVRLLGVQASGWAEGERADGPARRGPPREVEADDGRGGPHARQIRRIGGFAWHPR